MTRSVLVANPSADVYGSDRMMLEAVRGLVADGWDVVVAASVDGPLASLVQEAGARFVVLPSPVVRKSHLSPGGLVRLAASVARGIAPMVNLVREVRPDVVYVNTLSIPFWLAVATVMRVPSVNHVHEAETTVNPIARVGLELPARLASRVIFNSETSLAAIRLGRGRAARGARVVYNGVAAPPAIPAPRATVDAPRLAYVGRLSPRKGVDVAIATVSELADRGVRSTLTIVGDTFPGYEWYERNLREQVEADGLGECVTFAGFVPSVWPVLADIDILLVPSRGEESFGNVVIEAALSGRPVVASNHSGLQEAMAALRAAVAVPADDPRAMADAIERVMTDWTRMSAHALEDSADIGERFAPARFQRQLVAVLDGLVDDGRDVRSKVPSSQPVAKLHASPGRSQLVTAKGENP
jgi:glycosyltransferase involved in cell wall biosynthesis